MRVRERMQREPVTMRRDESLHRAERLMEHHRLRRVPVVRRARLIGMLTDDDLARAHPSAATTLTFGEVDGRLDQVPVSRAFRRAVGAVGRRTPLAEAVRLMRSRSLTALPVVRGDELVGMLTEDDLLAVLEALLAGEVPA